MTPNPHNCREENTSSRLSFWTGIVVMLLTFVSGAILSWRRWPDLVSDFGMQLYIPWRLAQGDLLYRDLFYIAGGPLSQYYHAALFKLFGISFLTLIISNLAITGALLLLIFHRFRQSADTLTASVIGMALIIGFAFAQYTGIGNCNFAAPYSHEMVHGFTLSVAALALLGDWLARKTSWRLVAAGSCLGLVALTKPDICLALTVTMLAAIGLCWKQSQSLRLPAKAAGLIALGALVPLTACFLIFLHLTNWRESLRWEFFGWVPVFADGVVNSPFYQWCLGFDAPLEHIRQMALHFLICAVFTTACAWLFKRAKQFPAAINKVTLALMWSGLGLAAARFDWLTAGTALPLLGIVTLGLLGSRIKFKPSDEKIIFPFLWTIFGLLLLAKQGVFPRIWHTGFVLVMPAFVSAIFLFLRVLPEFLALRFGVPPKPMQFAALGVLLVGLVNLARISEQFYAAKKLAVGRGSDVIFASDTGASAVEARNLNLALHWVETHLPPDATLATLPMGTMLNYLSHHPNPTPCFDWTPPVLAVFGEKNMTGIFTNRRPDYVALVEWQTYEYGGRYFGAEPGYGADVMNWIQANYQTVALFGSEPLRNGLFGIKILKWQPPNAATNAVENPAASH